MVDTPPRLAASVSFLAGPDAADIVRRTRATQSALVADTAKVVRALDAHVPTFDGGPALQLVQALESHRDLIPEMFAWYFEVLDHLEANDIEAGIETVRRLANVVAIPLADSGPDHEIRVDLEVREGNAQFAQLTAPVYVGNGTSTRIADGNLLTDRGPLDLTVALRHCRFTHHDATFWCDGDVVRRELAEIVEAEQGDHAADIQLSLIARDQLEREPELIDVVANARRMIRAVSPELADEVAASTHAYVLLQGTQFVGGSSLKLPGVIWLRMSTDWGWLAFADHIIHEAAHCSLFMGTELEPLVTNPNLECPSPIRRQHRPLLGTVHATFVFQRLVLFFEQLLKSDPLQAADRPQATARLHRHALGLIAGVAVVRRHAELTSAGKAWLEAAETMATRIQSEVAPSPLIASAVVGDYDKLEAASLFTAEAFTLPAT